MHITLKLDNSSYNIIWENPTFMLLDIYMELVEMGMTLQQLNGIKFIYNDVPIMDQSTDISITEDIIILLLINDDIIKQDFLKIIQVDNDDITVDVNLKTIELFKEPDFKELLRIITTKPELLNKVTSYITNGDISEIIEIDEDEDEDEKYETEYLHIVELLTSINSPINIKMIKSIIKHFKGHINLSLRYILTHNIH